MPPEYIKPEEFEAFLDAQKGERGISEFLKNRPQILYWTLCGGGGGHCRYVFREFPLGSSYVADFVVVNSYSGVWEVMFIGSTRITVGHFSPALAMRVEKPRRSSA